MTDDKLLISIITPYRDSRRFLPGLVATLQAQTHAQWECLLVDHASIDDGAALVAALTATDSRFRHLREPDSRPFPALPRNRALNVARGELICFLDADDLWHPEKLERQLAFHRAGGLEFSVTAYTLFSGDDALQGETIDSINRMTSCLHRRCPPDRLQLRQLLAGNPIPMLTVMASRSLLMSLSAEDGPFCPMRHEDYLLWLQLWQAQPQLRYGCLPEILAYHRRHGSNLTAQRWRSLLWWYRLYRTAGMGHISAAFGTGRSAAVAVMRAFKERLYSWIFACRSLARRL